MQRKYIQKELRQARRLIVQLISLQEKNASWQIMIRTSRQAQGFLQKAREDLISYHLHVCIPKKHILSSRFLNDLSTTLKKI